MRRANSFAAVITFFAVISAPLIAQDTPPDTNAPKPQARPPMHMPPPTNLQVLPKDISSGDLMKLMGEYSRALGVHCNFCHEVNEQTHQPNFASDAKEDKKIARTMIAMVQDINSRYMTQINDPDAKPEDKTVTCGTCHRGNTMPTQFVPKQAEHSNNMPMQKPQ
ncbi:MAG TPA: c-type cytochrome [Alloacidobacterium sp.]|jgi:hypothetical protein|nr:c-type cytochrome [Alloacidobacterium sp.]